VFATTFGLVEAAVVVYLRALYYPGGFAFPLKQIPESMIGVELVREFATIMMLVAVAQLGGRGRWGKFGAFLVGFGIWDITFYCWLEIFLHWPSSLFDWDILFLLPLPWIGPVLAPVTIALVMIGVGRWLVVAELAGRQIRSSWKTICSGVVGTMVLLLSFMYDTDATLSNASPRPYPYWMLVLGVLCYGVAFLTIWKSRSDVAVKKGDG